MTTPETLAEEYAEQWSKSNHRRQGFLAGYQAALNSDAVGDLVKYVETLISNYQSIPSDIDMCKAKNLIAAFKKHSGRL
jgi:hypothetical protein